MADRTRLRGRSVIAGVGVLVMVVAVSIVVVRVGRSQRDDRPVAAREAASHTADPATAGPGSETAEPIDGYARALDPCELVPAAVARRYVPGAVPLPNPRPPRDPLAVRSCTWKAIRVLHKAERAGRMRTELLDLSVKVEARASPALA
ncbi:MAG TPA: hypothetical protein VK891_16940, partial [Euzebyales bacterium]|nr:hypothetical protein [Euzebyales bacterium]